MTKDKFYHSGITNDFDGTCDTCPFWKNIENRSICNETESDVTNYVIHGNINHNCPFITK